MEYLNFIIIIRPIIIIVIIRKSDAKKFLGIPARWLSSAEVVCMVQWWVEFNWGRLTMLLKNTVPCWRASDVLKAFIALRRWIPGACWWLCGAVTSAGARPAADAGDDAAVVMKLNDELWSPNINGNLSGAHVTRVRSGLPPPYHCPDICITRTSTQYVS